MNKVLMTAVIVLPLVMFLAFFGDNIVDNFQENATSTKDQADTLNENAGTSGWGN